MGEGPDHEVIPVHTGGHRHPPTTAGISSLGDSLRANDDRGAVESLVGDHQIAAASDQQDRLSTIIGRDDGLDEFRVGLCGQESARGTPHPEGGAIGEGAAHARATMADARPRTD